MLAAFMPLALAFACLCAVALPVLAQNLSASVSLRVDVRRDAGPLPYAYRVGVFLNSLPGGYPRRMFLADQRRGMVQLSWDYYAPLAPAPVCSRQTGRRA
jgi:hypothetical protein